MRKTLCKLVGCDRPRFQIRTLCLTHIRERERAKKAEKNARRLERKLSSKKHQQSELKKWKAKTWKLMSEWVRRSVADWRGNITCYTCSAVVPYKQSHASHYIHGKLDYDERNLKACCVQCNLYLSGNLGNYTLNLIRDHGLPWVEHLKQSAAQHPGYTLDDCKRIHADLTTRLSNLNPL